MKFDPITQDFNQIIGELTVSQARNQISLPRAIPRSIQRSAYDQTNPGGGPNMDYTATVNYADENFWTVPAMPRSPTRIMASPTAYGDNWDGGKIAYYPLALRYGRIGVSGGRNG